MASVMGICGGLVGPKSGNVEKVLVFKAFLNGQRGDEYSREELRNSRPEAEMLKNHWFLYVFLMFLKTAGPPRTAPTQREGAF